MTQEYPSTTLLLIRHGQARPVDGALYGPDAVLTPLGRQQAAAIAEALVAVAPAAVYVSPFRRALDTASIVSQRLGQSPRVDKRLAEFELAPGTFENIQARPDLLIWRPEHRGVPGGETLGEFLQRLAHFCDDVVSAHPEATVAIVAHAGTIDAMGRWALGMPADSPWTYEMDVATASITEFQVWPRGRMVGGAPRYAELRRVGDVTHLNGLVAHL